MNFKNRLKLAWRVLTYQPGNLMTHAERELGKGFDVELQELILVFSSQGHSGGSAAATTDIINKLMRYEPLSPLTGYPDEWMEVGPGVYQNLRCGHVFKDIARYGGQAYDIDGIHWVDSNDNTFTNLSSIVLIKFPYTPKVEYKLMEENEKNPTTPT